MTGAFACGNYDYADSFWGLARRAWTRIEADTWLGQNVRWKGDDAILRGQECWSLGTLAKQFTWTRKQVEAFLKGLVKRGRIALEKCKNIGDRRGTASGTAKGTACNLISYLPAMTYAVSEIKEGTTKGTAFGHKEGQQLYDSTDRKEDNKDSCRSQAPDDDPDWGDPFAKRAEPVEGAGAGPSPETGAGQSDQQSASDDADLPKGSAQKGSGFDSPRCRGTSPRQKRGDGNPAEFEIFWKTCPRRLGGKGGKTKPRIVWDRWTPDQRAQALRSAQAWRERVGDVLSEYTSMVSSWINSGKWETEEEEWAAEKAARAAGKVEPRRKTWQEKKESEFSL